MKTTLPLRPIALAMLLIVAGGLFLSRAVAAEDGMALVRQGAAHLEQGDYMEALVVFSQASVFAPDDQAVKDGLEMARLKLREQMGTISAARAERLLKQLATVDEDRLGALRRQVRDVQRERDATEDELLGLRRALVKAQKETADVQAAGGKRETELQTSIRDLESARRELAQKAERLRDDLTSAEREKSRLGEEVATLTRELVASRQAPAPTEAPPTDAAPTEAPVDPRVKQLEDALAQERQRVAELEKADLLRAAAKDAPQGEGLAAANRALQEANDKLGKDIADLKAQLDARSKQADALRRQVADLEAKAAEPDDRDELTQRINELQAQLAAAESDARQAREQLAAALARQEAAAAADLSPVDLAVRSANVAALQSQLQDVSLLQTRLANQLAESRKEEARAEFMANKLRMQHQDAMAEIQELKKRLKAL